MKTMKFFFMAALALMTAACSEEITQVQQLPKNTEGIPFSATISVENSVSNRALAENGTTIEATWATGEKVALIYTVGSTTYLEEAEVTAQADGTATISTTLEGSPVDDTDVTIVYPASAVDESTKDVKTDLLTSQNGLLTGTGSISEKYELRKTSTPAKLKIDGTTASLKGTVTLAQQVSVWKLTLQNGGVDVAAKTLIIQDASENLLASATLATAGSVFYIAVPSITSVNLTAVNGTTIYNYSKASVNITAGKYYQSTVSLCNDLSALESANCYLVPAKGRYKFKATLKGNGSADLGGISKTTDASTINTAELIWATFNTTVAPIANELIKDISYEDGYVYFSTGDTYKEGNALVAIKDNSENILWSWHLWFESDDLAAMAQTYPNSGYVMMDRNLGALTNCYAADNALDFGFAYQNGRKDPFMMSATRTTYTALGVLGTYTSYGGGNVAYCIQHPTVVSGYDSWGGSPNLWSSTSKTIFDPCPPGWHIAPSDAWSRSGFNGTTCVPKDNNWSTYHGLVFNGEAWFPATGDRWGPDHNNTGNFIRVWAQGSGNDLWSDNGAAPGTNGHSNEGHGYSVRPVKDSASPLTKKFSVSTTKQVTFAPGNLQKVNGVWQFASHQYDYFGESQTDTQKDLFRFNDYSSPSGGTTWYALSRPEWEYLLASRSVTNSLSAGARYTLATLGGTYKGMIVFPDVYNHPAGATVSGTPVYNAASNYTATITLADWIKMELAGAIFLPAAGYYSTQNSQYENIGIRGAYTSTTEIDATYNLGICFDANNVNLSDNSFKSSLLSVRLVCD